MASFLAAFLTEDAKFLTSGDIIRQLIDSKANESHSHIKSDLPSVVAYKDEANIFLANQTLGSFGDSRVLEVNGVIRARDPFFALFTLQNTVGSNVAIFASNQTYLPSQINLCTTLPNTIGNVIDTNAGIVRIRNGAGSADAQISASAFRIHPQWTTPQLGFFPGASAGSVGATIRSETLEFRNEYNVFVGAIGAFPTLGLTLNLDYEIGWRASPEGGRLAKFVYSSVGPTIDACANGGIRSRNTANNADAPITGSTITANGILNSTQARISGTSGTVGAIGHGSYGLSVQNNWTSSWIEILNNGGAGRGAFFGINSNDFEIWNYQAGPIVFYTGATPSTGIARFRIEANGNITASGGRFGLGPNGFAFVDTTNQSANIRFGFNNASRVSIDTTALTFDDASLMLRWGTTSAFPAFKRSGTNVQVRLADDSAFAPIRASAFTFNDNAYVTSDGFNLILSNNYSSIVFQYTGSEISRMNLEGFAVGLGRYVGFSASSFADNGWVDSKIQRIAAGSIGIYQANGTSFGDLSLRNLVASGDIDLSVDSASLIFGRYEGSRLVGRNGDLSIYSGVNRTHLIGANAVGIALTSNQRISFSSGTSDAFGNHDVRIVRNDIGQLDVRSDNGVRFRNFANNADTPITVSSITASGKVQGTTVLFVSGSSSASAPSIELQDAFATARRWRIYNGENGERIYSGRSFDGTQNTIRMGNTSTDSFVLDTATGAVTLSGNLTTNGNIVQGGTTVSSTANVTNFSHAATGYRYEFDFNTPGLGGRINFYQNAGLSLVVSSRWDQQNISFTRNGNAQPFIGIGSQDANNMSGFFYVPNVGVKVYATNGYTFVDPMIRFGGDSSSFPAWKRSGTTIQARLADDSGFAPIQAINFVASATVTGINAMQMGNSLSIGYAHLYRDFDGQMYLRGASALSNFLAPSGDLNLEGGDVGGHLGIYVHGGNVRVRGGNAASTTGSAGNGGNVFVFGGNRVNSGLEGDVILAHTGSAARGRVLVGTLTDDNTNLLQIAGSVSVGTSSTTSSLIRASDAATSSNIGLGFSTLGGISGIPIILTGNRSYDFGGQSGVGLSMGNLTRLAWCQGWLGGAHDLAIGKASAGVLGIYGNSTGSTLANLTLANLTASGGIIVNNSNASNVGIDVRPWVYVRGNTGLLSGWLGNGASTFSSGASAETDLGLRANGAIGFSTNNSATPSLTISTTGDMTLAYAKRFSITAGGFIDGMDGAGNQMRISNPMGSALVFGNGQGGIVGFANQIRVDSALMHATYFAELAISGGGTYANNQSGGALRLFGGGASGFGETANIQGAPVYIYGGQSIGSSHGNVILAHTGSAARGRVLVGTTTDDNVNLLQVAGSASITGNVQLGASATTLGFYGTTAIARPTTAIASATITSPGGGNVIKTDDTFDGYTLAQIVKALKLLGLLE